MEQISQLSGLLQVGAVGTICIYLLIRTSAQLDSIGKKLDRLTRAQLIATLGQTDDPRIKTQAQVLLSELED